MAKKKPNLTLEMNQLEYWDGWALCPIAELVRNADGTGYLWVGNNAEGDMRCFATLDGADLRRLGEAIMALQLPRVRKRAKARG